MSECLCSAELPAGLDHNSDDLACSDHEIVDFNIFGVRRKKVSRVATMRTDFKLLRELVSSIPRESALEELRVHELFACRKTPFKIPEADNLIVLQVKQVGQKTSLSEQGILPGTRAERDSI